MDNKVIVGVGIVAVLVLLLAVALARGAPAGAQEGFFGGGTPSLALRSTTTGYMTGTREIDLASTTANADVYREWQGMLGSLTLTGPRNGVGTIDFFDTTTTNPSLRAANLSTSSIFLGSVPTSNATGTYDFNVEYKRGLIAVIVGAIPTSTISMR